MARGLVDRHAAATYYVLYRLTQQGFVASPANGQQADLVACAADGTRVALLRVRTRDGGRWNMTDADRRPAGRNVAYVFLEFGADDAQPSAFVLRGSLVHAMLEADPGFPREGRDATLLEERREAWQVLGLGGRSRVRSEASVSSSPVL